jgi:hypothetical protein
VNTPTVQALAQQQNALLQALFVRPGSAAAQTVIADLHGLLQAHDTQTARGLAAYQSNGHALAERALRSVYPVIADLIGQDNFAWLARDLWHEHPPQQGDLAQWGDALPVFLDGNPQLADTPYLGDVARAEWALHRAAGAPDAAPDLPSFARLAHEDPQGLTLTLAPGTAVIASNYPVASLVNAHLHGIPSLTEAGHRLREGRAEHALIWRQGWRPHIGGVDAPTAALLTALLQGADLPQALDAVTRTTGAHPGFDFSAWLTAAVTDGLVMGTHPLCSPNLENSP